jgi:hypothetical protein
MLGMAGLQLGELLQTLGAAGLAAGLWLPRPGCHGCVGQIIIRALDLARVVMAGGWVSHISSYRWRSAYLSLQQVRERPAFVQANSV